MTVRLHRWDATQMCDLPSPSSVALGLFNETRVQHHDFHDKETERARITLGSKFPMAIPSALQGTRAGPSHQRISLIHRAANAASLLSRGDAIKDRRCMALGPPNHLDGFDPRGHASGRYLQIGLITPASAEEPVPWADCHRKGLSSLL